MPTRLIAPKMAEMAKGATPATAEGVNPAWDITAVGAGTSPFDGSDVRVAVLDTGIDADHAAFTGVTLIQRDFSGSGPQVPMATAPIAKAPFWAATWTASASASPPA